MTYNPNIPAANDIISVSQGDLLTNFGQLNTIFDEDHVTFNAASNNGKHDKSTYVEQSGDPVTIANEVAVYSKDVAGSTRLFIAPESAGTVYQLDAGATPVIGNTGSTWIPGGLIIKWGSFSPAASSGTLNFTDALVGNTAFPTAGFVMFLQQVTNVATGTLPVVSAITATNFTFARLNPALTYFYVALGN